MIFDARRPVLITGGAGFIGTNLANHFLSAGQPVLVYDNLSRAGVADNLKWLCARHGGRVECQVADVRDAIALARAVGRACRVFHLAAQVAVTTSLADPIADFEVNARGTLNLLEALRALPEPPPMLFTSTNKVYGLLDKVAVEAIDGRYQAQEAGLRARGIAEDQPLDFHSPYGCSKGAADQYVLDYARIYGLPAVVFRMSCIYGFHQRGNEDQGWVAHFLLRALAGQPITLFGDGRQVRDALAVEDLVAAMEAAHAQMAAVTGRAFNIGGGPSNAISLRDLLDVIGTIAGKAPRIEEAPWRPADQRYYVSNIEAFSSVTGWRPQMGVREGVSRLHRMLQGSSTADGAMRTAAAATEYGREEMSR